MNRPARPARPALPPGPLDADGARAAIDAAGHPALFCVDCIASLGCEPFAMDALGTRIRDLIPPP